MRRWNSSRLQAAIGSIFMAAAQANVLAVASLDTLSQVGATLFGFAALYPLLAGPSALRRDPQAETSANPNRWLVLPPVLLALSLFFKESGLSYGLMIGSGILVREWRRGSGANRLLRIVTRISPVFAVSVLYLLLRAQTAAAGPTFGPGGYDLRFGANIPGNAILLAVGGSIPVSSVRVFESLSREDLARGSAMLVAGLGFALLVAFGVRRRGAGDRRLHFALAALLVLAFLPMAIMNHVSELHVYNAMPLFAMLSGAGLGSLLERRDLAKADRTLLWAVSAILPVARVLSVWEKIRLMADNVERAARLLQAVVSSVDTVPRGGTLFLVNPDPAGPE